MHLKDTYFQLFELAEEYHLDPHQLSERYRALQKEVHPDRFAHAGEREQLRAVQYTAYVNEALNTLRSPLKRAQYLLKLRGRELCPEVGGRMDPMFLMQQMELRERLEAAATADDPEVELESLQQQVQQAWEQLVAEFTAMLNDGSESALDTAVATVRKMQFLDKLLHEIELAEDELTDY